MRMRGLGWFAVVAGLVATGCLHRRPKATGFSAVVATQDLKLLEQSMGSAKARYAASLVGPKDGATIDRADWRVSYDGQEIAHGSEPLDIPFDGNGNAPLVLVVPVPYAPDAAALRTLDGKRTVTLALDGTFHFKHGLLYDATGELHFKASVPPPHLPTIKLAKVEGARFDTGESQVALTLEVRNPNDFPIVLTEAPYLVALGDQQGSEGVAFAGEPIRPQSVARYVVRAYLDPPSEDPDDRPRRTKVDYRLRGAVHGTLYQVRFAFDGTVKLRSGG